MPPLNSLEHTSHDSSFEYTQNSSSAAQLANYLPLWDYYFHTSKNGSASNNDNNNNSNNMINNNNIFEQCGTKSKLNTILEILPRTNHNLKLRPPPNKNNSPRNQQKHLKPRPSHFLKGSTGKFSLEASS